MSTIKSFTDLKVWQEGHKLVLLVYKITQGFPKQEMYSLIDQMRRSAASITANIAEGFGRHSYKEKLQFYFTAQGSLTELKNFILIARGVGYLNKKDLDDLVKQANFTHQLLQGFIQKTKSILNS
ncbi:MAG: four helix bundle protein [Candidatus Levybacteria bacterium]|nr:four helix bundle protein [Candidatus Levybacteria bacterium]